MFNRDINLSFLYHFQILLNWMRLIIDSGPNTIQNKKWKIGFIRPLTLFALFSYQLAQSHYIFHPAKTKDILLSYSVLKVIMPAHIVFNFRDKCFRRRILHSSLEAWAWPFFSFCSVFSITDNHLLTLFTDCPGKQEDETWFRFREWVFM